MTVTTTTVRTNNVTQPAAPGATVPATPAAPAAVTTPVDPAASYAGTTSGTTGTPVPAANTSTGGTTPLAARLAGFAQDPAAAARLGALAATLDPAVLAALKTPAGLKAMVEKLSADMVASDGKSITPAAEKKVFEGLAQLQAAGQLIPALTMLADKAAAAGALPGNIPADKKGALVQQFAFMIQAELDARGLTPGRASETFPTWKSLSDGLLAKVRKTSVPPAGPGNQSAFENPAFLKEFEALTGAKFSSGNTIKPLINGPASFVERDRMMDGAKKSIHCLTWAFYDDVTGMDAAKKLIEKHKQGVDVKVMVDGNVSRQEGHGAALKLMEDAGIPVIRWNDPDRVHDGQHRKVLMVDGKEAVAGGLNFGDVYSHKGPANGQKWRDTDVLMQGKSVTDSEKLFARLWNGQVKVQKLAFAPVKVSTAAQPATGSAKTSVIDDTPGPHGNAHIMLATLKAIEGATTSLDIENAYFIQTPALRDALLKALERGVKVRLLTNSAQSVDEPIVSAPILNSLPELVDKGAEVYLKKGDTLHSKFLLVDGVFTSIGSYNLHPRSERYEGEVNMACVDKELAASLGQTFQADIGAAQKIEKSSDIQVPKTAFSILASRFFFDQL